ncbi:DUF4231 domain-containing protein [Streptomyces sp. BA2]|uniref:DUF4231 domain-containing protein n=1 Tax=Streptomyces sp. BA2 TaxID=436595 RepID=UPI0013221530|nr:DUF4231 domain-containing protein [Streptomyces sp. BA2]
MTQLQYGLGNDDLPDVQRSADTTSMEGQKSYLRWTKFRLQFVVAAAIAGALTISLDSEWQKQALTGSSLALFLLALMSEIILLNFHPEDTWYHGRAVAESVKTLAWKFSVCADPFPADSTFEDAKRLFHQQLSDIVAESHILADYSSSGTQQVSHRMTVLRGATLAERKAAYARDRVEDQRSWYSRKAKENESSAFKWRVTLVCAEMLGALSAILSLLSIAPLDAGSALAAGVAAGGAWIEVKQFDTLSNAYALTATELALVSAAAEQATDEGSWSKYVNSAEQAISREHTMWLARRVRTRLPRRREP